MDGFINGQILLAGLLCALGLNALTAWVRLARAKAIFLQTVSAILQTLALPLVYVIVQPTGTRSACGGGDRTRALTARVRLALAALRRVDVYDSRTAPAARRSRVGAAPHPFRPSAAGSCAAPAATRVHPRRFTCISGHRRLAALVTTGTRPLAKSAVL
jgi:hypothetical protein